MLDLIDRRLLNEFQRDFPLVARPYAALAERLGLDEAGVIARLERLSQDGAVSRVGAVFPPHAVGASTLAALAAAPSDLEAVATLISAYPEVNHNYQREHRLNLWFVVAAASPSQVQAVLRDIADRTGLEVFDLPLEEHYHIDLGFNLQWN